MIRLVRRKNGKLRFFRRVSDNGIALPIEAAQQGQQGGIAFPVEAMTDFAGRAFHGPSVQCAAVQYAVLQVAVADGGSVGERRVPIEREQPVSATQPIGGVACDTDECCGAADGAPAP